jgi:hypothetical protein
LSVTIQQRRALIRFRRGTGLDIVVGLIMVAILIGLYWLGSAARTGS